MTNKKAIEALKHWSEENEKMTIEKIIKKLNQLEELKKMQELKEAKMIKEAVLIMNPKKAKIVKELEIKYVIFSDACEENKIYQITDKNLAQEIKDILDDWHSYLNQGDEK